MLCVYWDNLHRDGKIVGLTTLLIVNSHAGLPFLAGWAGLRDALCGIEKVAELGSLLLEPGCQDDWRQHSE